MYRVFHIQTRDKTLEQALNDLSNEHGEIVSVVFVKEGFIRWYQVVIKTEALQTHTGSR